MHTILGRIRLSQKWDPYGCVNFSTRVSCHETNDIVYGKAKFNSYDAMLPPHGSSGC